VENRKRDLKFLDAHSNDIRSDVLLPFGGIEKAPQPGRA